MERLGRRGAKVRTSATILIIASMVTANAMVGCSRRSPSSQAKAIAPNLNDATDEVILIRAQLARAKIDPSKEHFFVFNLDFPSELSAKDAKAKFQIRGANFSPNEMPGGDYNGNVGMKLVPTSLQFSARLEEIYDILSRSKGTFCFWLVDKDGE